MYYGKRQGGNRVTLFHEESGEYGRVNLEDLVREELHLAAAQAMAASVDERSSRDQRHAESVARLASVIAAEMRLDDEEIHQIRVAGLAARHRPGERSRRRSSTSGIISAPRSGAGSRSIPRSARRSSSTSPASRASCR